MRSVQHLCHRLRVCTAARSPEGTAAEPAHAEGKQGERRNLNEFVTNSIKHAGENALNISTRIRREGDRVRVSMADDGPGLGDALEHRNDESTGSGLSLIEGLLDFAGCAWEWRAEPSTELAIDVALTTKRVHREMS